MRFSRIAGRRIKFDAKLGFETLEDRTLLSAAPAEIHDISLPPSIIGIMPHAPTVPAAIAGKVDEQYWRIAEKVSVASQQGAITGPELQAALSVLQLGDAQVASINAEGKIRTVITAIDTSKATIDLLESKGAALDAWQFEAGSAALNHNELYAWIPAHLAGELAALAVVESLSLPINGISDTGAVNTAGDGLLLADDVRDILGFDGTGVRVGVISTGVPHRANVQATGDLPANITIDPVRSGQLTHDEGTAMLEIIHDLAPGAQLFFSGFIHLGFNGPMELFQFTAADMVNSINWLVGQGVDIIVDDIQFFNEPAFTDGIVAQAAANAVGQGVTFVTAAGNRADRHYQGQYVNNGFGFQDFRLGAQIDDILNVNVAPQSTVDAWLHWSDQLGTSANNYDIGFIDLNTLAFIGTRGNVNQNGVGGDDFPIERAFWTNTSNNIVQVGIVVQQVAGIGRELEIYVTPRGIMADDDATIADSMFGHKAVQTVISVGAIDAADMGTDTIEAFSSHGPATVYTNFATQQSVQRQALDGAAIDGVLTRVGQLGFFDNVFFGTSAAAPHAAAIAALLLEINPLLLPPQISSFLNLTAVDLGAGGYDNVFGSGRFDALAAAHAVSVNRGDFNLNGTVECADYTVWRSTFGDPVDPFEGADANGNGVIDAADYVMWANAFQLVNIYPLGDFNHDFSVGVDDYLVWRSTFGSTTDLRADANCNGVIDAADYVMWRETFGSTVSAAQFAVLEAFAQGLPPEVVGFVLSSASDSFNFAGVVGSGEQLRSVPLASPNMIRITFNQGVTVTQNALTLTNLDGAAPSVSGFAYDADSQTATWTFSSALADGRYLVRLADSVVNSLSEALDGEFTNPWHLGAAGSSLFASGNQEAGGGFRFRFTVLAADTDHNNIHGATNYQNWHSYEPEMIYASNTTDEFDGNLTFGDVSLREAVHHANTAGVATRIEVAAGRYNLTRTGFESSLNTDYNDLDILGLVTIVGAGPGATIIDPQFGSPSSSHYRAFEINGSTRRLDISGVTLTGATVWGSQSGGAAYVTNSGTLVMTDAAVVNNVKDTFVNPPGVGIRSQGGHVTLLRTVFTNNVGQDGTAVHASTQGSHIGSLTIGESIFALNTSSTGTPNVMVTGSVVKTNLGKNLFDNSAGGFFNVVPGTGDYLGTPHYVVTSILDTFDHTDNAEALSVREAVDKANTTAGVQEIWIPAWKFTLTRDRGSLTSDTDTAWGDLDVKQSTIIRGIAGQTSIAWKADIFDKVFDLLGDFSGGADANVVSSADYVLWQSQNGSSGGYEQFAADGDDDGDVDADDYTIWSQHFGNELDLVDVLT